MAGRGTLGNKVGAAYETKTKGDKDMLTQMRIGRVLLLIIFGGISYYIAFKQTPELNGVENAWVYRTSYGALMVRGLCFLAIEIFGLFPLE